MAKGKSTWKYNKLLTARRNYFNGFGSSIIQRQIQSAVAPPPISPDIAGLAGEVVPNTTAATTPKSSLFNNSTEGWLGLGMNAASNIGSMVGAITASDIKEREKQLVSSINSSQMKPVENDTLDTFLTDYKSYNPLGYVTKKQMGAISGGQAVGSALVSGASGALAGMSLGPVGAALGTGVGMLTSALGSIGKNIQAKKAMNTVNAAIDAKKEFDERSLADRARRLSTSQVGNLEANYAAFGGGLTHGANFTNGLISIDNGGSHETNPFEGVPMGVDPEGVPNLVEEGETIFNDYVFSKRLPVPNAIKNKYKLGGIKDLSFADASKILAKESDERPNDPISQRGLQAIMADLAYTQESVKQDNQPGMFAYGGKANKYDLGTDNLTVVKGTTNRFYIKGTDGKYTQVEGDNPSLQIKNMGNYIFSSSNANDLNGTDYYYDPEEQIEQGKYADWLRYAPAVGYGMGFLTDAIGLTNKPDYSNADAVLEASNNGGTYHPVSFKHIGDYLTYNPFDRDYYINKQNEEAGATRRALLNTSAGNRGTAMAGLLATDKNYLEGIGSLARQGEEYNLAQRHQVKDFSRTTNTTNSQGFLQADMANQSALAGLRDFRLKGTMAAAEMRDRARLASDQAKSNNVSGLFQTIGDIGFEEENARMRDWAIRHAVFGPGVEDYGRFRSNNNTRKAAKGGKIKRKKGLTL